MEGGPVPAVSEAEEAVVAPFLHGSCEDIYPLGRVGFMFVWEA